MSTKKLTGYQELQALAQKEKKDNGKQSEQQINTTKPEVITSPHLVDCRDCICGGGIQVGHKNEAGGFCCPHYGHTCGIDHSLYN